MTDRTRPGRSTTGRTRPKAPPDYYHQLESDHAYVKTAHARVKVKTRKRWLIRLAVIALLALIAHFWGPTVVRAVQGQGRQTVGEFKGLGRHIRDGVDRRSGVGFDETSPDRSGSAQP